FRVTVERDDTRVDVMRGQVEVHDFKTGQYAQVYPDQSARVSAQGTGGLSLSGSGLFTPIQQGTPRRSSVAPLQAPTPQPAEQRTAAATNASSASDGLPLWTPVPRGDADTTRYSSHEAEGGWGWGALMAKLKQGVGLDKNGSFSAFDLPLPAPAPLMVPLPATAGPRPKP